MTAVRVVFEFEPVLCELDLKFNTLVALDGQLFVCWVHSEVSLVVFCYIRSDFDTVNIEMVKKKKKTDRGGL